jgi:hypothetical protein
MKMCEEHVIKGKSISDASEMYGGYDIGNLKYLINIYKRYGSKAFLNRENGVYKRDTKLLAIDRVKHGESIRSVAISFANKVDRDNHDSFVRANAITLKFSKTTGEFAAIDKEGTVTTYFKTSEKWWESEKRKNGR